MVEKLIVDRISIVLHLNWASVLGWACLSFNCSLCSDYAVGIESADITLFAFHYVILSFFF